MYILSGSTCMVTLISLPVNRTTIVIVNIETTTNKCNARRLLYSLQCQTFSHGIPFTLWPMSFRVTSSCLCFLVCMFLERSFSDRAGI